MPMSQGKNLRKKVKHHNSLFKKLCDKYPQHIEELTERSGIIADGGELDYKYSDKMAAELIIEKYSLKGIE